MEYLKPQSPIKIGENYIYPLTTSDQIINGDGERIKNIADTNEICYLYSAIFSLDSWIGEGPYTQAATLTAVDGGGQVTAQSILLACVGIDSTLPQETKDAMQSAASDIINAEKTLGANTISVSLTNKPNVEVELYFLIKEGNGTNVPPLDPVGARGGMKLLWTNPSPSTSFSPQTVQLSEKCNAFYVSFFAAASNNALMQTQFVVADGGATTQRLGFINYNTNIGTRDTTVHESSIEFGNSNSGAGGSVNNANVIPYKIYGIKF